MNLIGFMEGMVYVRGTSKEVEVMRCVEEEVKGVIPRKEGVHVAICRNSTEENKRRHRSMKISKKSRFKSNQTEG